MDQGRLQNKPSNPKTDDPRQKPANQGEAPKCSPRKTTKPLNQRPSQAARGGGRTVILPGTYDRAFLLLPGVSVFFTAVRFPGGFLR